MLPETYLDQADQGERPSTGGLLVVDLWLMKGWLFTSGPSAPLDGLTVVSPTSEENVQRCTPVQVDLVSIYLMESDFYDSNDDVSCGGLPPSVLRSISSAILCCSVS